MPDRTLYDECRRSSELPPEAGAELEAVVAAHPEDLLARVRLIGFYLLDRTPESQERRNGHIHWLISHHPEVDLEDLSLIFKVSWPAAYEEGKRRWMESIAARPDDAVRLRHASEFLALWDADLADHLRERGAALEPSNPEWPRAIALRRLVAATYTDNHDERRTLARQAVAAYETALALETPSGRLTVLVDLATAAVEADDHGRATDAAQEILDAAPSVAGWNHGNLVHHGHIVLGRVALANDDVVAARAHLAAAGETPGSPQLDSFGPDLTLASALLSRGEHDAVIVYLEACKAFWKRNRGMLEQWQERIRQGETPTLSKHAPPGR